MLPELPEYSPLLFNVAFFLLAGLTLLGAAGVVFFRSIVYSALSLLMCFLSIAGLFVTLNAPFIGAAQILVYAVGLTIVMIFGVMLTGDHSPELLPGAKPVSYASRYVSLAVVTVFAAVLLSSVLGVFPGGSGQALFQVINVPDVNILTQLESVKSIIVDGGVSQIAALLFSNYAVAFELASILLLLAMMGAILLSKKNYPEEENCLETDEDLLTMEMPNVRVLENKANEKELAGASH